MIVFTVIGIFLNVIANSIRIREFVLTRKINAQKDTDELTNLKNKGALTREINQFLADESADRGILFILDIDQFKTINDTYGHDTGDDVIRQVGRCLGGKCTGFCDACFSGRYPTKIPEKMLAGKERGGVDFDKKLPPKNNGKACIGKDES